MSGKILNIGIHKSYGFPNGSFIEYQIGNRKIYWSEKDSIAEDFCIAHGIKEEKNMWKLENRKFEIIDEEYNEDGLVNYLIRLVSKRINPEGETFWLYDNGL